jgi:hypothetical protein
MLMSKVKQPNISKFYQDKLGRARAMTTEVKNTHTHTEVKNTVYKE